ncbi:MAG: hypothetical protein HRT57_07255, partial [Crocinitomicaceae bacterium]|nr:hypothetical protein [Crocinitomicaceae bacterium]
LAFAQPYFADGTEKLNSKKSITCFYLDNSFSMQARGPEGELLSEAREKSKEVIKHAPRDARFIIGTNEMSGREERVLNRREAFEKIDAIELCPLTRDLSEVLKWQKETLDKAESDEKTKINYFIFSDFQKEKKKKFNVKKDNIMYFPTRMVPEQTSNVYIDSVWFTSPIHKVGKNKELNISVVNMNDENIENLELTINIDSYSKTVFINAPSKQKTSTSVSYADKTVGYKSGKINVVDEHVFFDDTYFISYEVQEFSRVLIINGEDAITGTALIYELNDFYKSRSQEITAITKEDFENQDLIVVNGANKISSGLNNYLSEFIKAGGSVSLFPGKTPNKGEWNSFLSAAKLPLLGNSVSSGNKIKSLNYADPFYDGVFEEEPKNLNLPSVSKTFRAVKSNVRSTDLITLQNGLPLLAYTRSNGNVFMFYSSIHEDFGNFSRDALFTTVLLRSAELAKRKQPISLTIGSASQYPIYKKITGDNVIHITGRDIDFIPQRSEISGVNYLTLNKLDNYSQLFAGNYKIQSETTIGALSLNYNRSESKLNYYSNEDIDKIFEGSNYQYNEISSDSELSTSSIDKPFSYWKICIIFTLIFVLGEMLLVRLLK